MKHIERFANDVERYLASKFPDLKPSEVMEATEYIVYRGFRLANDSTYEYIENQRKMEKLWRRNYERKTP